MPLRSRYCPGSLADIELHKANATARAVEEIINAMTFSQLKALATTQLVHNIACKLDSMETKLQVDEALSAYVANIKRINRR